MKKQTPKSAKIRVYVVEDHVMVREGFVALINSQDDMTVCGQSGNAREAAAQITILKADLALIDLILNAGDGLELIKDVRSACPGTTVLVVSMQDEEVYAERALHAGASGYVMKSSASRELLEAIRAVMNGQVYISRRMTSRILNEFRNGNAANHAREGVEKLSDRELEIFQLIGSGMPVRQIAERLGISTKTVESHRENIKHKLGIASGFDLVQYAADWSRKTSLRPAQPPPVLR